MFLFVFSCDNGSDVGRNAVRHFNFVVELIHSHITLYLAVLYNGNNARLLADDDGQNVRFLGNAYSGAVTGTHLLVYVALSKRKEAARGDNSVASYDDRSVVQRSLSIENTLQKRRRQHRVEARAGIENIFVYIARRVYNYDCADVLLSHILTGGKNFERGRAKLVVAVVKLYVSGRGHLLEYVFKVVLINHAGGDNIEKHDKVRYVSFYFKGGMTYELGKDIYKNIQRAALQQQN